MAEQQANPGKHLRAEMRGPDWKKMQAQLGLTDEQVAELETLTKDQREKANAVRDDTSLSKDQKREEMKKLREQGKAEVDSVLTVEQREKMKQLRDRRNERIKEKVNERKASREGKKDKSSTSPER